MDRDALRAYAGRRWSAGADADRRYWAARHRSEGSAATVAAAEALWRHMRETRPDWPDARERASDLEHHVSLKRLLDRCAGVVPSR
jgi:hypothetical protein